MKIALTGDSHLRGRDLDNRLLVFSKMLEICQDEDVSYIVHGGDLFDRGEVGDKYASAEKIVKSFIDVYNGAIPIILLSGNHDQYGDKGNGLDFIHHSSIIKVENSPKMIRLSEEVSLACIPWIRNDVKYSERVYDFLNNAYGNTPIRLLVGHLNVIGCSIGHAGYVTAENYFSFGLPDLKATKYNPTRMFFSHIHTRMLLGSDAEYLGALTPLRFHEDEGKLAGFHILDTDTNVSTFYDLTEYASTYKTMTEEAFLSGTFNSKDYIRFYTSFPEKYKHLPNVTAMLTPLEKEKEHEFAEQLKSNVLNIDHLIASLCQKKELKEPQSPYYTREKNSLALNLNNSLTGFESIDTIHLKNLGVHKDIKVQFKKGFNCITGKNGAGKTCLIESIYGALYETFPERGNIKNFMKKGSFLELNVRAKDTDYLIRKEMANKRFLSFINGTCFELVNQYRAAIEPIFGDSTMFGKLVFLDQNNKFDIVKQKESNRLQVLRDLFDLQYFDEKLKEYKETLKEANKNIETLTWNQIDLEKLENELLEMEKPELVEFSEETLIEKKRLLKQYLHQNSLYSSNLVDKQHLLDIEEYENNNNVEEVENAYNTLKMLKQDLKQISNWSSVGCKNNPLPCIFIKNLNKVTDSEEAIKQKIKDLDAVYDFESYNNYLFLKRKNIKKLDVDPVSEEILEALRSEISSLEALRSEAGLKRQLHKAYSNLEARIGAQRAAASEYCLSSLEEEVEACRFLIEVCGKHGLSLLIIDIIKQELQTIIDELISFSELNLQIELSTSKDGDLDNFSILFGKEKYDIALASGGEIALVRILFKLAIMVYLNRYFGNYKVLILDEPTAALDDSNTDAVIDIIKKLCNEFNQIIVVSHDSKLVNSCDHRIAL